MVFQAPFVPLLTAYVLTDNGGRCRSNLGSFCGCSVACYCTLCCIAVPFILLQHFCELFCVRAATSAVLHTCLMGIRLR